MQKAYNRIYWENYPKLSTPLNESNLNKMDAAIEEVDNRVISLDTTKATKTEVSTLFSDIAFDETTGILTFTRKNGGIVKIDTKLEKLAVNFSYDAENERLVITLDDGSVQYVDMKAIITQYEFAESDTIILSVDSSGKVKATIKNGSITGEMLEPNYLANVTVQAESAAASASAASMSATNAAASAETAAEEADRAETAADRAESVVAVGIATTSKAGIVKPDGTTIKVDADGTIHGANTYTHPNSGVSAGTYRKVTVNAQGHVTGGSNPTTAISEGGTGATTAAAALANLGGADIEEGTFTLTATGRQVVNGTTQSSDSTITVGTYNYIKVGKLVYVWGSATHYTAQSGAAPKPTYTFSSSVNFNGWPFPISSGINSLISVALQSTPGAPLVTMKSNSIYNYSGNVPLAISGASFGAVAITGVYITV